MRRSINDQFGFSDRRSINPYSEADKGFGYDSFRVQNANVVGKYIAINFIDYMCQSFNYKSRISSVVCEKYSNIPKTFDPFTNVPVIFKVVRFDSVKPYRAILVSIYGHVIVTTTTIINKIGYYDVNYCREVKNKIESLGKEMYTPIICTTEQEYINNFASDYIHSYPVQSDLIYGKRVWIEFEPDMKNNYKYNKDRDKSYTHWGGTINTEPNQYEFTDQMAQDVVTRNPDLKNMPREILASYPSYYNIHSKSFVDNPKRVAADNCSTALNYKGFVGYIIRADENSSDGHVVVTYVYNGTRRYVCLDEAKFYYETDDTGAASKIDIAPPTYYLETRPHNLYTYLENN